MPRCQSCLQVTLFAGGEEKNTHNKLAFVRGCQTECHNTGSTAAGDLIKVAAKLTQKKPQKIHCDLIRNALPADHFCPGWWQNNLRTIDRVFLDSLWATVLITIAPNLNNKKQRSSGFESSRNCRKFVFWKHYFVEFDRWLIQLF